MKPAEWGELKTEAIDFSKPFLWFEDDLLVEEQEILASHDALDGWIGIDLARNPGQLRHLISLLDNQE